MKYFQRKLFKTGDTQQTVTKSREGNNWRGTLKNI